MLVTARLIAITAFFVSFAAFMAWKYIKKHAQIGIEAARRAAEAVDSVRNGAMTNALAEGSVTVSEEVAKARAAELEAKAAEIRATSSQPKA